MSVHEFIDELGKRGLLADRLSTKLREKVAQSERPLSARAVAKFLVQKQHLSQQQATDALNALLVRGVDVDAVPAAGAGGDVIIDDAPTAETEDDPESSSIFAPYLREKRASKKTPPRPTVEADDMTPMPAGDAGVRPAPAGDPSRKSSPAGDSRRAEGGAVPPTSVPPPLPPLVAADSPLADPKSRRRGGQGAARRLADGSNRADRGRRKQKTPVKRKNEWDSPLILIGGGALVLLVLCGVTVYLLLRHDSGDELLQEAEKAVASGSYTQAIQFYQDFVDDYQGHSQWSAARVKLALARLRRDTESGNLDRALATAEKELADVENEEAFADTARDELAALLPRIAQGLADQADATADLDEADAIAERATTALTMASRTKYVAARLRDPTQLDAARATLSRVKRRRQTHNDLQQALAEMETAAAAGDTRAAYATYRQLVKGHPELTSDAALAAMIAKTSAAERAGIRFVADERPPETTEPPTPWLAALTMAHRSGSGSSSTPPPRPGEAIPVCVRVDEAVYGLDSVSGQLLWRRHVGVDARAGATSNLAAPIAVGGDVLVTDAVDHALLRLDAATGQFRWRAEIGEPFAPPLVVDDRAYLAAESGRLYLLDVTSGTRAGFVEFAQPLRVTPAADRQGRRLYLTGEHSSLYCLLTTDMSCLGVYYLGHSKGSIQVAPAAMQDKLAVLENDGAETCRLRLLSLDDQGAVAGQVTERRLTGLAASPPLVSGRRLIVVTDRGRLEVFDVGAGEGNAALSLVATREVNDAEPLMRYVAVDDGHIWVADTQLTKHAILPTGNRLPVESIDNDYSGATFDHPLALVGHGESSAGRTLIHAHRPRGRAGVVVAAMDAGPGHVLWETTLAVPPAGPPIVDPSAQAITAVNANGDVFRFDAAAIRSGVLNQPLAAPAAPAPLPALTAGVDFGQGRAAFSAPGFDRVLLVDPRAGSPAVQWAALPGPLACAASRLGDGLLAPLAVGQVLYLDPANARPLAAPFQPLLEPGTPLRYTPTGTVDGADRRFLITDGREKMYLVAVVDQPQPHLAAVAEAAVGPDPIVSPMYVLGDLAVGVTKHSRLVRFHLPSLEPAGEAELSAPVVWGPHPADAGLLLVTADGQMTIVSAEGRNVWNAPLEHGEPIGAPLIVDGNLLVAYRQGVLERRALGDGQPLAIRDVAQALAAGPVPFLDRVLLTVHDGTLLLVDQP